MSTVRVMPEAHLGRTRRDIGESPHTEPGREVVR